MHILYFVSLSSIQSSDRISWAIGKLREHRKSESNRVWIWIGEVNHKYTREKYLRQYPNAAESRSVSKVIPRLLNYVGSRLTERSVRLENTGVVNRRRENPINTCIISAKTWVINRDVNDVDNSISTGQRIFRIVSTPWNKCVFVSVFVSDSTTPSQVSPDR